MNPKLEFIFSRRSVRQFLQKEISETMIQDLLDAAMAAPSACGKDPRELCVVQKPDLLLLR